MPPKGPGGARARPHTVGVSAALRTRRNRGREPSRTRSQRPRAANESARGCNGGGPRLAEAAPAAALQARRAAPAAPVERKRGRRLLQTGVGPPSSRVCPAMQPTVDFRGGCADGVQRCAAAQSPVPPEFVALFPVAERMNADPHRPGELCLREPGEMAKRSNVITRVEASRHEPLTQPSRDRAVKLPLGQLRNVGHWLLVM